MTFTQDQRNELIKIFQASQVALAYIFGSAAKDKLGPLSDLDFAILFSKDLPPQKYFKSELKIAGEIGSLFGVNRVDIVNLAAVNNPALKHSAVFDGQVIFFTDPQIKFAVERKIMMEYEDTSYLRETSYRIMRQQIKDGTFGTAKLYVPAE